VSARELERVSDPHRLTSVLRPQLIRALPPAPRTILRAGCNAPRCHRSTAFYAGDRPRGYVKDRNGKWWCPCHAYLANRRSAP
jgi:hypothetical protein